MDYTVVAFLWLICGVISAAIMSGKTDSQGKVGGYFLLGILLGIFGVLFAAVAPNEKTAAGQAPSGPTRSCPLCKEMILADAIKCKHCGERLDRLFERV